MLETQDHGAVRELRLARPPVNAFGSALTTALVQAIEVADDLDDEVTADLFNEITAGLDKDLWFLEAHLQ